MSGAIVASGSNVGPGTVSFNSVATQVKVATITNASTVLLGNDEYLITIQSVDTIYETFDVDATYITVVSGNINFVAIAGDA